MTVSTQITFRGLAPSPALEEFVREKIDHVHHMEGRVLACHVVLEESRSKGHQGHVYEVKVHLSVPGGEDIDVSHEGPSNPAHQDPYVAVRDAFKAVERRLEKRFDRLDDEVKAHEPATIARVAKLDAAKGVGLLETPEGLEIYFHRNSVVEGFEKLHVGDHVRYALHEGEGEKGPQASSVHVFHAHHG